MSTLRKLALGCSLGVLLLSGAITAQAAEPTPKELFESVWTSRKEADLDEATYVAVSRNPKLVVEFIEIAFSHADKDKEQAIVDAALKALRDVGTVDCDVWIAIASAGSAKSDEDDKEYMIGKLAGFLNPGNCPGAPGTEAVNDDVPPKDPFNEGIANAIPLGGVGAPQTLETFIMPPPSGNEPPPPPPTGGGGGGTAGPPFIDDDDDEATPSGAGT